MTKEKIYFWPEWFNAAYPATAQQKISPPLVKKLNQNQLYLWRSLNIYDDFLDGNGPAAKLPLANRYRRRYLEFYYRLNLPPAFYQLFNRIMTEMEEADRDEALSLRLKIDQGRISLPRILPDFENLSFLARKSLALALGPLAIIYWCDGNNKNRIKHALNLFRFTLAAKQLSDDARDWLEDLRNQKITAANVLVLRAAQKRKLLIDLEQKPEILHLLFAAAAAEPLAKKIQNLCTRARQESAYANLLANNKIITEIIAPLEKAVTDSQKFRTLFAKSDLKML